MIRKSYRLVIFLWWMCLEIPSVYALAHPLGHEASPDTWFMGAMLGTLMASMFCGASSLFIAWVFFDFEI